MLKTTTLFLDLMSSVFQAQNDVCLLIQNVALDHVNWSHLNPIVALNQSKNAKAYLIQFDGSQDQRTQDQGQGFFFSVQLHLVYRFTGSLLCFQMTN